MKLSSALVSSLLITQATVSAKNIFKGNREIADLGAFEKEIELSRKNAEKSKLNKREGRRLANTNFHFEEADLENELGKRDVQNIMIPEAAGSDFEYTLMPDVKTGSLAMALTQTEDVSIFSSYLRDMVDLYQRCENTDEFNINTSKGANSMLLIFAPVNEAIVHMSQKPWEFPEVVDNNDNAAARNIRHFAESHIVEGSSMTDFSKKAVKLTTLNGNEIYLKNSDQGFVLTLDDVDEWLPVSRIQVTENGALLVIDKTLTWPGRE